MNNTYFVLAGLALIAASLGFGLEKGSRRDQDASASRQMTEPTPRQFAWFVLASLLLALSEFLLRCCSRLPTAQ